MKLHWAVCVAGIAALFAAGSRADEFKPPADGKFTEKQLETAIATQKDIQAWAMEKMKAMEKDKSTPKAIQEVRNIDEEKAAIIKKHGISEAELKWVWDKAFEAWGYVTVEKMMTGATGQIADVQKKADEELAAAKKELSEHQAALKDGRTVMTKEERDNAVGEAKEAQKSAEEEAKQHAEEAKSAAEDAAKADAEAKAADAAAKSPPADVTGDDRASFIQEKQNAAQSARDHAKEAREKEAEARKAEAESRAKLVAAKLKAERPDVPTTEDEKADAKRQNEEAIQSARERIKAAEEQKKQAAEAAAQFRKEGDVRTKRVPAENVALLKKHQKEFTDVLGIKEEKKD